jgi:protein required for attachment to host cells
MPNSKTLYVLADGARARLVERSRETGHFVTFVEIDARERLEQLRRELRASHAVRSRQSGTPQRNTVGREDFTRQSKEAFVTEVADRAVDVARQRGFETIVVAAPARLIGPMRDRLAGRAQVSGVLERDLTKSPDAALPKWLDHVFSV